MGHAASTGCVRRVSPRCGRSSRRCGTTASRCSRRRSNGSERVDVMADECTIERTVRIEAPPEMVFDFLTDPDRMPQWMGFGAELDPRPGGVFRCEVVRRALTACGEFVAVERPHRVVFTWG